MVVPSSLSPTECAKRGATMLDRVTPYWYERVSVGTLNLASTHYCVLGQLFGDFHIGMAAVFGVQSMLSDEYGFSAFYSRNAGCEQPTGITVAYSCQEERECWEALTHAWREEITQRRMQATSRAIRPRFVAIDEVAVSA